MAQPPNVRYINPPTIAAPRGYSHIAEVRGGRTIYIAGQLALDPVGNVVGQHDFRAHCQQVFENLKAALTAVGGDFSHVVKMNIYLTDISQLPALREVRDTYVNTQNPPVSTAVEVRHLFRDDVSLEIEAIAITPE